ncbi:helix-turn-helix domain-containing protein [Nonomuraea gerenzanensis]|nr:helix-turn-helix transcriptional regulator [Nonomuraea gerenzanensis]UBU10066.1 helix-turn-helix domain-containing protein [Nonomuraea gerenzanensis]
MIGSRLRHLRLQRNLRQDAAAAAVDGSVSKISRMERGLTPLQRQDLTDLLALYGVTDPAQREVLISVAVGERDPAWWDDHDVPLEETVLWHHEHASDLIRTFDPLQLPDLLQTEEYARAATLARHYPAPLTDATENAVKNVLRRQDARTARLWAVIDEPVLWRPIAGDLAMHLRQLDALIAATEARDITVQILPGDSPFQPCSAPFTIFRVPGKRQTLAIRHYTSDVIDLVAMERYGLLWDQLIGVAHCRDDTPHHLARIRRTLGEHR